MPLKSFITRFLTISLFLVASFLYSQNRNTMSSAELLEKAIDYHDPNNQWSRLKAILNVRMETPNSEERLSVVQLNNAQGVFSLEAKKGVHEIYYRVGPEGCRLGFNGTEVFTQAQAKEHRLNCEQARKMKNYYTYLYGLPMKLKDKGTQIDPNAQKKTFMGKTYWVLKVGYDPTVGKDIWYFYFDTQTYALRHYQFYHDLEKGDGEYILLSGELEVAGIKMPQNRAWYTNKDAQYLGTDFLSLPE